VFEKGETEIPIRFMSVELIVTKIPKVINRRHDQSTKVDRVWFDIKELSAVVT